MSEAGGTPALRSRTVVDTLAWAGDGAAHLRGLMTWMGDDAFAAPSGLPGWSRAHVLSHVARHADAMINLLAWAATGVPTPAYASPEQRDADIESGAARTPAAIRDDVVDSSDRLAQTVRELPEKAWSATIRTVQGREIPATDVPWLRAREMWIHAVDLDVGASLADAPIPMLLELITDAAGTVGAKPDCPALLLVATDRDARWTLGSGAASEVSGRVAGLAGWLIGRSTGRDVRVAGGGRPPVLPRWI